MSVSIWRICRTIHIAVLTCGLLPRSYSSELQIAAEAKAVVSGSAVNGLRKASFVPGDSLQPANDPRCLDLTARMLRFVQAYCDY